MSYRRRRYRRNNKTDLWMVLFIAVMIAALWQWILLAGVLTLAVYAARRIIAVRRAQRALREQEMVALVQRADMQNDLFLRGDPTGIYGSTR